MSTNTHTTLTLPTTTPTVAFEEIGPDEARALLNTTVHNRSLRPARVEAYARDMRAGNWLPTGEPIQITPDGILINGQHRLRAVLEADMNIMFLVLRDAGSEYQRVADAGLKRTFGDVLQLEFGETNVHTLAAAVRQIAVFRRTGRLGEFGGEAITRSLTTNELVEVYLHEVGVKHSLPYAHQLTSAGLRHSNAVSTALHYLYSEADPNEAGPYFTSLATGEMLPAGDARLLLRRRLEKAATGALQFQFGATLYAAIQIKAFNAWRQGKTVTKLSWMQAGPHAEEFPRILTAEEIG